MYPIWKYIASPYKPHGEVGTGILAVFFFSALSNSSNYILCKLVLFLTHTLKSTFHKLVLYDKEWWQSRLSRETVVTVPPACSDGGCLLPFLETGWALDCCVPMDRRTLEQTAGNQHSVAGITGRTGMTWNFCPSKTQVTRGPSFRYGCGTQLPSSPPSQGDNLKSFWNLGNSWLKFANSFKIKKKKKA